MLNLAMYSASICLKQCARTAASLKVSCFEFNVVIHTSAIERLVCMVKLSLSKDCCISVEAFLFS